MRLIVGLGNPGPKYSGSRHNVGFMCVTDLARQSSIRIKTTVCRSKTGEGMVADRPVYLALPQTLMNASGAAVQCLARRLKLDLSDLLIVCDDRSLPLGMIRLRARGSDGGHKGLASVLAQMGTDQIARLRVGIRSPSAMGEDLTAFVLGRFSSAEKKPLEEGLVSAVEACEFWVTRGISAAMNHFNRRIECRV